MIVCIAEKPSVAMEIAKVLGANRRHDGYMEGNGYQVTWVLGHLCRLCSPDEYYENWKKWTMATLPMVPAKFDIRLIDDKGVKAQFKIIKGLFKTASAIINCGDAGQEGEVIQRWVMRYAGVKCPVKRLWVSSLTEEALKKGFAELKDQSAYDSLYEAGRARAEGDWLLGMNATRLYTLKYSAGYGNILSIGRVQTPTLGMIVNRDRQIAHFRPENYWVLTTQYRDTTFTCPTEYKTEPEGKWALKKADGHIFQVIDVTKKRGTTPPPQLFDLTSLQVECNKRFGFSAKTTLANIQSLYEKKLTTYPRVDTKFLPEDVYAKCPGILGGLTAYKALAAPLAEGPLPMSKRVFDGSKVTDHHAIIPTGVEPSAPLNDFERKVYDLIVRRFIAAFYPPCEWYSTTVLAQAGDVDFKTTGKTIVSAGWTAVRGKQDADKEQGDEATLLPAFLAGEKGMHKPSLITKTTQPPKHHTEATLLQAMETAGKFVEDETLREAMKENGIGRPSSRAGIIETLLSRGYVVRDKKTLLATQAGCDLMQVIHSKMLSSPELTGHWEKKLRDIEAGRFTRDQFMSELTAQLCEIIHEVQGDTSGVRVSTQAPKYNTRGNGRR